MKYHLIDTNDWDYVKSFTNFEDALAYAIRNSGDYELVSQKSDNRDEFLVCTISKKGNVSYV